MSVKCVILNVFLLFSTCSFSQVLLDIGERTKSDSIAALILRPKNVIKVGAGSMLMNGDFNNPEFENFLELQFKKFISPKIAISGNLKKFDLESFDFKDQGFLSGDLNLEWCILPKQKFSPYIFLGAGILTSNDFKDENYKVQGGVSLEYLITKNIALIGAVEYNYIYDEQKGSQLLQQADGAYYIANLGIQFYFGNRHHSKTKKKRVSKKTPSVRDSNKINQD